jgi:hypothetical protein
VASINRLSPILAIAVGVVHAGLAPVLAVADVRPNLALVAVVLVTCWVAAKDGAIWAFLSGLSVNVLSSQPLGAVPLSLLAASALTAGGQAIGIGLGPIYPLAAVVAGSIVADAVTLVSHRAFDDGVSAAVPVGQIAIGAALNGALAGVAVIAAWALRRDRRRRPDSVTRWSG